MLKALTVQDFAVVRELDVELGPGLTVITGETGAGKSILVDALALALGDRADPAVVRAGAERAVVTATFDVAGNEAVRAELARHDLAAEDECILRRVIGADGRSRAFCNGTPVPAQVLKQLGEALVDIHGQHAHHSLLQRPVQRALLDAIGGPSPLPGEVAAAWQTWQQAAQALAALRGDTGDAASRADFLRFQLDELDALGEDLAAAEALDAEHRRLAHASRLRDGTEAVAAALFDGEANAQGAVNHARASLADLARLDPGLGPAVELVEQAAINLGEAERELAHYRDRLEVDPGALARVERRLTALHDAARKHRCDPAELRAVAERLRQELAALDGREAREAELAARAAAAEASYRQHAAALSAERRKRAGALAATVTGHLPALGMPHGRLEIAVTPGAEPAAHGLDEVEFLVTTNPDQPPRPLRKVASGGELSRISLALQVALAGSSGVPVLVYDEVDTGIGGRVAVTVAQHLQAIAKDHQVLCITHLAQVAAAGSRHLLIEKAVEDGVTRTFVRTLSAAERVEEVARMLGGARTTARALAHARELLAEAPAAAAR